MVLFYIFPIRRIDNNMWIKCADAVKDGKALNRLGMKKLQLISASDITVPANTLSL